MESRAAGVARSGAQSGESMSDRIHPLAGWLAALARGISGVEVRWNGGLPNARQRIYFANHSSHLDFIVLWSALPGEVRARARPVAAKDYWERSSLRRFLALQVFRAVLVERGGVARTKTGDGANRGGPAVIEQLAEALGETDSLILFPEGTRGTGEAVAAFRSGLFHLARRRPDVELVPAYLENLNRILPKGEVLMVPLVSMLTFGARLQLGESEEKEAFLERTHAAVCNLRRRETP
jgi:1-acyl-sn-glycerol-3-phosphate acyltransferase